MEKYCVFTMQLSHNWTYSSIPTFTCASIDRISEISFSTFFTLIPKGIILTWLVTNSRILRIRTFAVAITLTLCKIECILMSKIIFTFYFNRYNGYEKNYRVNVITRTIGKMPCFSFVSTSISSNPFFNVSISKMTSMRFLRD